MMKHLQSFNKVSESIQEPEIDRATGHRAGGILYGDRMWIVYVFESAGRPGDRFKSMSGEQGDTFENLVNVIKGGTAAQEIAGIFKSYDLAKTFYDTLKYRPES